MLSRDVTTVSIEKISLETLPDRELLERIVRVAGATRYLTAELLALIGECDARKVYLGEGCSSLFAYCTQVLHLSEHAAYHRIEAARAARCFPIILEMVAEGAVTLATIALLRPHLTADNHRHLLAGRGAPERLLDYETDIVQIGWSSNEQWTIAVVDRQTHVDIVARGPGQHEAMPLLAGPASEFLPALSPDNRWLAYASDETGRSEVYVVPFPDVGAGKWQLTTTGGLESRWSRDGRTLFVRTAQGRGIDAFDMRQGPAAAARTRLFERPPDEFWEVQLTNPMMEVTADGRFIMVTAGRGDVSGDLILVSNFLTLLAAR